MFHTTDITDNIVAIATPPGQGGIAIVKISGRDSGTIAKKVFRSRKDPMKYVRTMIYGHIVDNGENIDEALMCYMKAPHSYTGEDVVEIQTHGGYAAASFVIEKLVEYGARIAEPGEFTKRAFLNGKIDLIQAESVMEIVSAEGKSHLKQASKLMNGTFSKRITTILEEIVRTTALAEANIDFLPSEQGELPQEEIEKALKQTITTLDEMISSYTLSTKIKQGVTVAIAGMVNSGKSSLFNKLLEKKRAIVSPHPGTTRDWIEARIDWGGVPITLIDTAGLREAENDIEIEGIHESKRIITEADIVVYLSDLTQHHIVIIEDIKVKDTFIPVLSKSDLASPEEKKIPLTNPKMLPVSSITGEGIEKLRKRIIERARALIKMSSGDTLVMVERHMVLLKKAREALERAINSVNEWSEEIISYELREAQNNIEAILGIQTEHTILDDIFSRFCIGK